MYSTWLRDTDGKYDDLVRGNKPQQLYIELPYASTAYTMRTDHTASARANKWYSFPAIAVAPDQMHCIALNPTSLL